MSISSQPPDVSSINSNDVFLYMLKLGMGQTLDQLETLKSRVIIGECSSGILEHAEDLARTVYGPLLAAAQCDWSELVVRELDESLSAFLANVQIMRGHVRGLTSLPIPAESSALESISEESVSITARTLPDTPVETKYAIHSLESSIITWTKQIKNVLKQDPETSLPSSAIPHPGPGAELTFWVSKARNLNFIFIQLQSTSVRRVLSFLDRVQSTYNGPFANLCKALVKARLEANDNVKFLRPLRPLIDKLEDPSSDFASLQELFVPILHVLFLVWKSSRFYNSPTRLVVFLRECCNALVLQATRYLNRGHVFQLIDGEDARDAVNMLRTTLRILAEFKKAYMKYKEKTATECPENPWNIQNNAVFVRLDAFWERIHDLLELTCTTMQFSNLARIEVGGTKGKVCELEKRAADVQTLLCRFSRRPSCRSTPTSLIPSPRFDSTAMISCSAWKQKSLTMLSTNSALL